MKRHFCLTDIAKNSNKYWIIDLQGNSVITSYGRVGGKGAVETKNFPSDGAAQKYFDGKIKDKQKVKPDRRDCYTEINIVDGDTTTTTSPLKRSLRELALTEIETNSDSCKDLIGYLVDANIHNITSSTTIKYNVADGCFRTPLGVVDKICIDQAKLLLQEIEKYVLAEEYSSDLLSIANKYFRLIPQDLGSSHKKIDLKGVFQDLRQQYTIIEGLEAAVVTEVPAGTNTKTFNTSISLLPNIPDQVKTMYNGNYKLKNAYSVNIKPVVDQYSQKGAGLPNKVNLWHATGPGNLLSIMRVGLIIPPNAANGSNHGKGVYFSDNARKSLQYAYANTRNGVSTRWMLVSEVALGNIVYDTRSGKPKGFDSRWAYKGGSESQIIVYDEGRANILFLCELVG